MQLWLISICFLIDDAFVGAFNPPPPSWLTQVVVDWAAVKGLQMVAPTPAKAPSSSSGMLGDGDASQYIHLPVSLLPSSFPRQAFTDVVGAAPIFNELVDRISRNRPYLEEALNEVSR